MSKKTQKKKSTSRKKSTSNKSFNKSLLKVSMVILIIVLVALTIYFTLDFALHLVNNKRPPAKNDYKQLSMAIEQDDYPNAKSYHDQLFETEKNNPEFYDFLSEAMNSKLIALVKGYLVPSSDTYSIFEYFSSYISEEVVNTTVTDLYMSYKTQDKGDLDYDTYNQSLLLLNDLLKNTDFLDLVMMYEENALIIKESRDNFKNAEKLEQDKEFLDAYYSYILVSKEDVFYYEKAQNQAVLLKDQIIDEILNVAKTFESEEDYENAYYTIRSTPDIFKDEKKISDYLEYISDLFEKDQIKNLVPYTGIVYNMFFHSLALDANKAFSSARGKELFDIMATRYEFIRTLDLLYENNFILISPHDIYDTYMDNGVEHLRIKEALYLPENKKPLIMSFDNMACTHWAAGFCKKILIDDQGNLASLVVEDGVEKITYDGEHVLILEDFINKHPDFSYKNARATIGMSGYENMFGHETAKIDGPNYKQEIEKAKAVADKLKEMGFIFANHSYYHFANSRDIPSKYTDLEWLQYDTELWHQYIRPVLGDTNIYITPGGKNYSVAKYVDGDRNDPTYNYLVSQGYQLIFSVGRSQAYTNKVIGVENPRYFYGTSLFMDRYNIDGKSLYVTTTTLKEVFGFDSQLVIDPIRASFSSFIS